MVKKYIYCNDSCDIFWNLKTDFNEVGMNNFQNNEERLQHIGLMCCTNLHDAFAGLSKINSVSIDDNITTDEKLNLIRELSGDIREMFRGVERFQHQSEKLSVMNFRVSEITAKLQRFFRGLEVNILNDFEVTCQRGLLVQILINLIDNAFLHSKIENLRVLVTVDKNTIIVSDNGIGISEEIKDKIFDLFFTTRDLNSFNGMTNGVGLYGVKYHIDKLGFDLDFQNGTILSGANFKITIP